MTCSTVQWFMCRVLINHVVIEYDLQYSQSWLCWALIMSVIKNDLRRSKRLTCWAQVTDRMLSVMNMTWPAVQSMVHVLSTDHILSVMWPAVQSMVHMLSTDHNYVVCNYVTCSEINGSHATDHTVAAIGNADMVQEHRTWLVNGEVSNHSSV